VAIVALLWFVRLGAQWVEPGSTLQFIGMFFGPLVGSGAVVLWWLFASRVGWTDRGVLLLALLAGALVYPFYDASLRELGLMGVALFIFPVVITAWVLCFLVTWFQPWRVRRAEAIIVGLLAWGAFGLFRFQGTDGSFSASFPYRWSLTGEEKLLAEIASGKRKTEPDQPKVEKLLVLEPGDWPGFRGPDRDARLAGVRIATDWKTHPPRELWRQRVGPGWSSFAVVGRRLYTQEQRGEVELVVCYDVDSGEELWIHKNRARFTEAIGGPGPRATPTFYQGNIYALGATGWLNCLDAASGHERWSRDIVGDSGAKVPQWGFAASPLVVGGVVAVFAGGPEGKSVLGYDASSGDVAWTAGDGRLSYCSLHFARFEGVEQLLLATEAGLTAFHPALGQVLWQHDWALGGGMARVVQPALVGESDVLLGTSFGVGTRRLHVSRTGDQWAAREVWTSLAIKPYYNDLVIHKGHLYGFDGPFFTCLTLDEGKAKWRARGYGNGQVLLLADQDLLLVLSEKGDVALLETNPDAHKEIGRFKALEGKTWNHPVVAHGRLFVRNGEEMACYQLTEEGK
jgi:outer membrane protein assembly factor BamB